MNLEVILQDYQNFREKYYSYDMKMIEDPCKTYDSLSDLGNSLHSGRFSLNLRDYRFECFFHNPLSITPRFLYVLYDTARKPLKEESKPYFPRWTYFSVMESLEGAMLCIEDPMLYRYTDLRLGWYYGTQKESAVEVSLDIVKAVCSRLHISPEHVIFFGSSGAGYAGIYAASILNGSLAIAINPQIYIQSYKYAKTFSKITGIDLSQPDDLHRNDVPVLMKSRTSRFCILFNMEGKDDMNNQVIPLCKAFGIDPCYGLASKGNLMLWLYHAKGAPNPHNSVETRSIFAGIDYIAKSFHKRKEECWNSCKNFALLMNESWHDIYEFKAKMVALENKENPRECMSLRASSLKYLPVKLNGNDMIEQIISVNLPALDQAYHTYTYDNFQPNMMYEIRLDVEADYPEYAIGILDKAAGKTLMYQSRSTKERAFYRCMTGDHAEGLRFVIHAGLGGKSQGKALLIKNLTILARSLKDISDMGDRKQTDMDGVRWYDACRDILKSCHWIQFKDISSYDHHVMPWRESVEIFRIIERREPTSFLELGLGESSKLLAQYANAIGANHMIIDEDKDWCVSFLNRHSGIFRNTKVHISPLLDAEKDAHKFCAFRNFSGIVGDERFQLIIQHRPRGGTVFPHMDIGPFLPGILAEDFVILIEHADQPEEQLFLRDISDILEKHGILVRKDFIPLPEGELCVVSNLGNCS